MQRQGRFRTPVLVAGVGDPVRVPDLSRVQGSAKRSFVVALQAK
jgi:hypothetical protein